MKLKVHVYSQECKQCGKVGDVNDYEDENDRLSEFFVNDVLKDKFKKKPYFKEHGQRGSNPQRRKPHEKSLCLACKAGLCGGGLQKPRSKKK